MERASAVMLCFIAVVATSCGNRVAAPGAGATQTATANASALATPTPSLSLSPSAEPSAAVIATCPARVRNVSGAYAFSCPTGWRYLNCEQTPFTEPSTLLINPEGCRQEQYNIRMIVWSRQGDHSAGENTYLGQPQSSKPVVVAGASGTRQTYAVSADNLISPAKGTVQVVYTFLTGGRSYFAMYNRYPSDADVTSGFDQMVTTSLTFSASG